MEEVQKSKITIVKASYGVPDDPKLTRNVTQKLQAIIDGGVRNIQVSALAKGNDPLVESGLLGPVIIQTIEQYKIGK